jgi:hypothetical protein
MFQDDAMESALCYSQDTAPFIEYQVIRIVVFLLHECAQHAEVQLVVVVE